VPQFIWVPEVRKVREEKYFYSANPEQYAVARDALNNFYHLSPYGAAPQAHAEPGGASASQALGGGAAVPPAH